MQTDHKPTKYEFTHFVFCLIKTLVMNVKKKINLPSEHKGHWVRKKNSKWK